MLMFLLSGVGALISLYLWNAHVSNVDVICTTGCDAVLQSKYGSMMGVPVGAYGTAFYVGLMGLIFLQSKIVHKLLEDLIKLFLIAGGLFTLYLRYLEFFILHEICIWCWGSVVVILAISLLFILISRENKLSKK